MILLAILLIMAIILVAITVLAISVGGATFILLFGDVIVCIFIVAWIIKRLIKKNRES